MPLKGDTGLRQLIFHSVVWVAGAMEVTGANRGHHTPITSIAPASDMACCDYNAPAPRRTAFPPGSISLTSAYQPPSESKRALVNVAREVARRFGQIDVWVNLRDVRPSRLCPKR